MQIRIRVLLSLVVFGLLAMLFLGRHGVPVARAQATCPQVPVVTTSSAAPPTDVCIPDAFSALPLSYFDDYSWRAFIALVWPASDRGTADLVKGVGDGTADPGREPRVFETLKSDWEIYNGTSAPLTDFDTVSTPNPCNVSNLSWSDVVLGSFTFSKLGNLGQAGNNAVNLSGPLVAQNRTYVRYATGFNRTSYNDIKQKGFYLLANQSQEVFDSGAIDVKAAWMDMTNVPHPERFYTRPAWVYEPDLAAADPANPCVQKTIGLVALHIVQKTPTRPQWIWTTFEHVDNVPPSSGQPMSFNDGSGAAMPASNPIGFPPSASVPTPFNV